HIIKKYLYSDHYRILLFFICTLSAPGCKKFITVDPPVTSTNGGVVYATDKTAIAVLTGIYTNMSAENNNALVNNGSGFALLSLYPALSADELTLAEAATNASYVAYYQNSLDNTVTIGTDFWDNIYAVIFKLNSAIDGLSKSTTLTPAVKSQLLGEAYFMRAFSYFYLIQIYGDVPLILSTDYSLTSQQGREARTNVYNQIVKDLEIAQSLMEDRFLDATLLRNTSERVRPNKSAASALLARTYLYLGEWVKAETEASKILVNKANYDVLPISSVFLKNSKETIWALQTVDVGSNSNTGDARLFVLPETGPSETNPVYLNQHFIESFETDDDRLTSWISRVNVEGIEYSYAYKYKIGFEDTESTEYPIVLRLSEQYLIRAEARAQQGNLIGAKSDLDVIRFRASLNGTLANNKEDILGAILEERRHELFT
ncbi:MAG: RagB/SusD family nutrient uptake outer membrane protein, partial [Pedobacter sp.]